MKITCKINVYGKQKKKTDYLPIGYWAIANPDYDIQYRMEIMTVAKEDYKSTILASKVIEKEPNSNKMDYLSFHTVNYVYSHAHQSIYCTTLEQKI